MIQEPAQLSDVDIYPGQTSKLVEVTFWVGKYTRDVSGVAFTASVLNGETNLGAVPVTIVDGPAGKISSLVGPEIISQLGRYSTWRLFDPGYDTVTVERRIVMQR